MSFGHKIVVLSLSALVALSLAPEVRADCVALSWNSLPGGPAALAQKPFAGVTCGVAHCRVPRWLSAPDSIHDPQLGGFSARDRVEAIVNDGEPEPTFALLRLTRCGWQLMSSEKEAGLPAEQRVVSTVHLAARDAVVAILASGSRGELRTVGLLSAPGKLAPSIPFAVEPSPEHGALMLDLDVGGAKLDAAGRLAMAFSLAARNAGPNGGAPPLAGTLLFDEAGLRVSSESLPALRAAQAAARGLVLPADPALDCAQASCPGGANAGRALRGPAACGAGLSWVESARPLDCAWFGSYACGGENECGTWRGEAFQGADGVLYPCGDVRLGGKGPGAGPAGYTLEQSNQCTVRGAKFPTVAFASHELCVAQQQACTAARNHELLLDHSGVATPKALVGTAWKIIDTSSTGVSFGNNPASEEQLQRFLDALGSIAGGSVEFTAESAGVAGAACRWKSASPAAPSADLPSFPARCGEQRPFLRAYALDPRCETADAEGPLGACFYGAPLRLGVLSDTRAILFSSNIALCLERPKGAPPLPPDAPAAAPPPPEADCVLNPASIVPVLDAQAPGLQSYSGGKRDGTTLVESALLSGGTHVTFEIGGCAHLGYSFTYEGGAMPAPSEKAGWIGLAQQRLAATPVRQGSRQKQELLEALEKAKSASDKFENGRLSLPCGDATCTLEVSGEGRLKLGYDFAL